jgi:hypothetical protein
MKVRMLVSVQGDRPGPDGTRVEWPPRGAILETDEREARDLISAGMAVKVGMLESKAPKSYMPTGTLRVPPEDSSWAR